MLSTSIQHDVADAEAFDVRPDHTRVVAPPREIDAASVPHVERELSELRAAGFDDIVVDLRSVTFMDSAGLHLLLRWHRAARASGWRLRLLEGSQPVRRLIELTGTAKVFDLVGRW
jgi:anti-sigma B factor antagonist